jgi:hypothetical protein
MTVERWQPPRSPSFSASLLANRLVRMLAAFAWALASEIVLIAVSPAIVIGVAVTVSYTVFLIVFILHDTENALASSVWWAGIFYGFLSLPFFWVFGAFGLSVGIRRILDVPLSAPLLGAMIPPTLFIALVATGNLWTAIGLILELRRLLGYDDF